MSSFIKTLLLGLFLVSSFQANALGDISKCDIKVCHDTIPALPAIHQASVGEQSIDFFSSLLDTGNWPSRWGCGTWTSFHGWLYIISDVIIWFAYFMIPLIMGYFIYRKKAEPIPFKFIALLFITFILACGLTHLIDAAIFWWPAYRLSALIRFVTAVVSLGTVIALIKVAPKVLEFKSPEILEKLVSERTEELRAVNERLQEEIDYRKKAEVQLTNLNQQIAELNIVLEKKVEERTAQLYASTKELEAFTYSVSHDLRTPLRSIDGHAKILEEDFGGTMEHAAVEIVQGISRTARRMGKLIDNLLDFSRMNRKEIVKSKVDMNLYVREIINELSANEQTRKVKITLLPLEAGMADINMIQQVWLNLLQNAFKYSSKVVDNAKVEVGSYTTEEEVCYYVKDNGVGFDMKYVDKLFNVFQRLHAQDEFDGTGVGLAIVNRIVLRHGGRVWAEGILNKGATFYFSLPKT